MIDLISTVLLGTSAVFSLIELGLSGAIISGGIPGHRLHYSYSLGYIEVDSSSKADSQINMLLFCSLWTLLVSSALIIFPIIWAQKRELAGRNIGTIFGPLTLGLNAITMIFWLSGFAALANDFRRGNLWGIQAALLAFAILIW
jgi:hypothetical protein